MKKILNDSGFYYEFAATPSSHGEVNFETNTKADNMFWNIGRITLSYEDVKAMMTYFEELQAHEETHIYTVESK